MNLFEEIKQKFRSGDSLIRLLLINTGVFLLISVFLLIRFVTKTNSVGHVLSNQSDQRNWFQSIPEDMTLAASSDPGAMLMRPWSLITHMFAHIQFGHFLFNMVALYTMGQVFVAVEGYKRLTSLYILGGLSGYLLFALSFNFLDVFHHNSGSYVLGASAAVMAITVAAATLRPKQVLYLFGAVKLELMWLALILVLLDLVSVREGVNSGGHIGHIGGALFGYIYARQIQKGNDMGAWLGRFMEKIKSLFNRRKMTIASNNKRAKSDEEFNLEKKARQKRVDEILDKIGRSGYDSLSKEEKDFLFRNSQK